MEKKRRGRPKKVEMTPVVKIDEDVEKMFSDLMHYIEINCVYSIESLKKVYLKIPKESVYYDKVWDDPQVKAAIEKKNQTIMQELREALLEKARGGDIKAINMAMKLYGSEEELARLNGGGLALSDVKQLGTEKRPQIFINATGRSKVEMKGVMDSLDPRVSVDDAEIQEVEILE